MKYFGVCQAAVSSVFTLINARAMPLTYLNDALREVAFEGHSLWDVRMQILVLLAWGVVAYFVASKLFKWE